MPKARQTVDYAVTGDFEASDISSALTGSVTFAAGRDHQDHHRHHRSTTARRGARERDRHALRPDRHPCHAGDRHRHGLRPPSPTTTPPPRSRSRPIRPPTPPRRGTLTFTVTRTGDAEGTPDRRLRGHRRLRGVRHFQRAHRLGHLRRRARPSKTITVTTVDDSSTRRLENADRHALQPAAAAMSRRRSAPPRPPTDHHRQRRHHLDLDRGRSARRSPPRPPARITFTVTRTGDAAGSPVRSTTRSPATSRPPTFPARSPASVTFAAGRDHPRPSSSPS